MLFKKTLLIISVCIITQTYAAHPQYTPETTEIFWDIHKVIIQKNKTDMLKTLWQTPNKLAILSHIFNWGLLKDLYAISKTDSSGGAYVERLREEDERLADFAMNMANSQVLIDGMEDLILELAKQGYTMYVASNIGSLVFEKLKQKYPNIFNENVIKDGKTVDFQSDNLLEKPDSQFFVELAQLRDKNKPYAIFIDDKQENIDSAKNNGFISILFKNAEQLAQDLN